MSTPTIWACGILDAAIAEEARHNAFKRDQIRVSSIGSCPRVVLAQALGYIPNEIPWDYNEGGHLLEKPVEARLRAIFPATQSQVRVKTSAKSTWTHPDHFVIGTMNVNGVPVPVRHGVQQKSTGRRKILEYLSGIRDPVFGLPKHHQVQQCLLEWYFWKKFGFCLTDRGRRIDGAPDTYELLYLGREDFGESRVSIPVEWDSAAAQALADEFDRRVECLVWHQVPPRVMTEPGLECGYVRKHYDWDGAYDQVDGHCLLYESCWGRSYAPKWAPDFRIPKKGWHRTR